MPFPSIVITGLGAVSSIGREQKAVAAMRAGRTSLNQVILDDILPVLMGRVSIDEFSRHGGDMAVDFSIAAAKTAWKRSGLEDHSIDPWRVATVIGSSKGRLANLLGASHGSGRRELDPGNFPGNTLGLEVAREMQFSGPVLNYPAACATGIVCMIRAIHALQCGDADIALAGSGEASGKALLMSSFRNMGALNDDLMRPFNRKRGGFNPGEGAAVFVLEREDDARARGAKIIARVAGWDQRADAYHITSADPEAHTVAYSIDRALRIAGWLPADVEYINAHGTGTPLNDLVEGRAIRRALPGATPLVSSVKPFVGHLLGASSAVELALSILCLADGFIPPTPGLDDPDPDIPLHFVPAGGVDTDVRRFLKLSLGFGGHIGVLALEMQ